MCCLEVDDRERWISNQLIILERSSAWLKQILGSLDTKHSLVTSLKREYEEKWHELFIQSRAKLRKKRKMNIRIFFLEKHVQNFLMNNQNNFFFFWFVDRVIFVYIWPSRDLDHPIRKETRWILFVYNIWAKLAWT